MAKLLTLKQALLLVGLTLAQAASISAQDIPPAVTSTRGAALGSISGRVVLPSGHPVGSSVRVTLSTPEDPGLPVYTDNNGNFGFGNLPEGNYTVEVFADRKLYEPVSETVRLLRSARVSLVIYLKERVNSAAATGNVVSAEADQKVPAPAKREYERGTKLIAEGKIQEGIERFKQALVIFPTYLIAHNDLGVQYLKLNQLAEAAEQFEAAIEVNSNAFNPRLNLGIALVRLKRYSDALDHLRKADSLDSSSPSVHLYQGIALLETDELDAAQRELAKALSLGGPEYSVAHFYLGLSFMKAGDREKATRELKTYLENAPNGNESPRARQLLQQLGQL